MGEWYAFRSAWPWAIELLEDSREHGGAISSLTLARCYWQTGNIEKAAVEYRSAMQQKEADAVYLQLCLNAVLSEQSRPQERAAPEPATRGPAPGATTAPAPSTASQTKLGEFLPKSNIATTWSLVGREGITTPRQEPDGSIRLDVLQPGTAIGLSREGLPLQDGAFYRLSYKIKTDCPREIGTNFRYRTGLKLTVVGDASVQAGDTKGEWQTREIGFVTRNVQNRFCTARFSVGDPVGTIWLKDISLVGPSRSDETWPAATDTELLPNWADISKWTDATRKEGLDPCASHQR